MEGEISRQRAAVAAYFERLAEWLPTQGLGPREVAREVQRQRNILDYLEVTFSENRIRQYYALYLWGRGWKADYEDCPEEHQARAANCPYEECAIYLVKDWAAFKKAPAETELQ